MIRHFILHVVNVNIGKFAMIEIHVLILSMISGGLSAVIIMAITKFYWTKTIKKYTTAGSLLEQHIAINEIEDDIVTLRLQVIALQAYMNQDNYDK